MNSKQLANILVKLLGLDLCVRALPTLAAVAWFQLQNFAQNVPGFSSRMTVNYVTSTSASMVAPVISAAVGIILIGLSRSVVNLLFQTETREPGAAS